MLLHYAVASAVSAVQIGRDAGLQSFQSADIHLLTIFAGIAAISLLVLVLIVVGVLGALVVVGLKAKAAAMKTASEVKGKVYPIIDKTNGLVTRLSPTIQGITEKTETLIAELSPKISGITGNVQGIVGNVEQMSFLAKQKLEEFSPTLSAINQTVGATNETVRVVNTKTHQQVERVNNMVTSVLDKVAEFPAVLSQAVQAPVKAAESWISAVKKRAGGILPRTRPVSKT